MMRFSKTKFSKARIAVTVAERSGISKKSALDCLDALTAIVRSDPARQITIDGLGTIVGHKKGAIVKHLYTIERTAPSKLKVKLLRTRTMTRRVPGRRDDPGGGDD